MDNESELANAIKAATANLTVKKAADYKAVYANICRTNVGPFDIRLVFGQTVDTDGKHPGEAHQEDVVTIILSPMEAKAISQMVPESVAVYEKTYGEIKDPTPILKKMLLDKTKSST